MGNKEIEINDIGKDEMERIKQIIQQIIKIDDVNELCFSEKKSLLEELSKKTSNLIDIRNKFIEDALDINLIWEMTVSVKLDNNMESLINESIKWQRELINSTWIK